MSQSGSLDYHSYGAFPVLAAMMYTGPRGSLLMNEYIGIAVSFILAGGIAGLMVFLGSTLGKKHPTSAKLAPFECGKDPFSLPIGRLAIKFYLTAILFVLFDVELVFLYPWAVVYREKDEQDRGQIELDRQPSY